MVLKLLRELLIENFKSIKNFHSTVNDLNILIGPNNSGKTAVLQTLALLKQSIDQLTFNGKYVELGNFKDAVNRHDARKSIHIDFSLSFKRDRINDWSLIGRPYAINCFVVIKGDKERRPFVASSIITSNKREIIDFMKDRRKKIRDESIAKNQKDVISKFDEVKFDVKGIIPKAQSGGGSQFDEYKSIYDLIVDDLENYLYFLSAKRGTHERTEAVDDRFLRKPRDVGIFGELTIPVLAHIQHDDEYSEAMEKIHYWLKRFGLTKSVARIVEGVKKPGYSLEVTNMMTQVHSNIVDIGFGLNQLFPVIVQCFFAPKESLIVIEQPEAHLHPRAQADLADFLIDVVNYGNGVIVETHSEHLLLRLQTRLAERKITPKKVNIYYFEQSKEGTKISNIKIDEQGYFVEPIPEGFFEEGFREALAHIRASYPRSDKVESDK